MDCRVAESVRVVLADTAVTVNAGRNDSAKYLIDNGLRPSRQMARRLLRQRSIMQIPYDLEFVENRPTVRAIALREPFPAWRHETAQREPDALDSILRWIHRLLSRLEKR